MESHPKNNSYSEMPRLTSDERQRALGMLEAGLSARDVARHMACHHSTIMRLRQRVTDTGSASDRPRPGRQRATDAAQDDHIRLQHLRDRFRTAVQTARETPGRQNDRVSVCTIRRRLHAARLRARRPYRGSILNAVNRHNRREWSRQHRRWLLHQWNTVLFSDESRICVDRPDRRRSVWRRQGERFTDSCVREANRWGGASVMVWGAISTRHRTPLVIIERTLTAQRYIDHILRPVLMPFLAAHNDVTTFQQDNARPHAAHVTQDFLHDNNVNVMPWPPYSPDLSPIEHLWDQLKTAVARRRPPPRNRRELTEAVQDEWQRIPQARIGRLVRSMRRRCTACFNADGGHTRY